MKILIRESTLEDAEEMAPFLRAADIAELKASVGESLDIEDVLRAGVEHSDDPRTMTIDGDPVAMFGVVDSKEGTPKTGWVWLLGTDEITENKTYFLRNCKKHLAYQEAPYEVLTNFVDARNTVHINWLRWMGFYFTREVENYGAEKRTFYEFARIKVNV
jgi:hypothetical protein